MTTTQHTDPRDAVYMARETFEQEVLRQDQECLAAIMQHIPGGSWRVLPAVAPVPYIWWKEITGEQVKLAVGGFLAGVAFWCAAVSLFPNL